MAPKTHGFAGRGGRHSLYSVYHGMRSRCLNPNGKHYKDYGGRGITICKLWLSGFEPFVEWALASGYRKGLYFDRINNNKGYSPANCRWVSARESVNNRRTTVLVKYKGKLMTVRELSEISQVSYRTFHSRFYHSKLTLDEMVNTPLLKKRGS